MRMAIVNRLTVDGRDYILSEPVDTLKAQILAAIRAGGDYVTIPSLITGSGLAMGPVVDILFSPGMPVMWSQIDVGGDAESASDSDESAGSSHDDHYGL